MIYSKHPKIKAYKNDSCQLKADEFEIQLFEFITNEFGIYDHSIAYSNPIYYSPSRDTQFNEGYTRDVYHELTFENGDNIIIHFSGEDSSTKDFASKWIYSFYSFTLVLRKNTDWENFKRYWLLFKSFLTNVDFRDVTLTSNISNDSLYQFYESDEKASQEIINHTTTFILEGFQSKNSRIIEIQNKPHLDISYLLGMHPSKENVTRIQINANNLTTFPKELYEFPNLENLIIHNNKIATIPNELSNLNSLTQINIHSNPIKDNAEEMSRLDDLLPVGCSIICF